MSGFASGLLAGSQTAGRWISAAYDAQDRADKAAQLAEQKAIMEAQPEQVQGFSAGQGELLRQAAAAGNTIGWDAGTGSYTIQGPGSDSATPVSPQAMTHFLGGAQEGSMSPAQANQMRYGALARSVMARDPAKGAVMAAGLTQLGQAEVAAEKAEAFKAKEADFYKQLGGMSFKDMVAVAGGAINPDPEVGAMISYDPKTKEAYLASSIEGVPAQKVTRAELMGMLGSAFREGQGDLNMGVKGMLAQMQAMRAEGDKARKAQADVMLRGAQVDNYGNQIETRNARVGIAQQKADQDGDFKTGSLEIQAANARSNRQRADAYATNQGAQARRADRSYNATPIKAEFTAAEQAQLRVWEKQAKDGDETAMGKITALANAATDRAKTTRLVEGIKQSGKTAAEVTAALRARGASDAYIKDVLERAGVSSGAIKLNQGPKQ